MNTREGGYAKPLGDNADAWFLLAPTSFKLADK
jgi:hypothetical protein